MLDVNTFIMYLFVIGDCSDDEFQCGSSECIHTDKVCNEIIDCSDGSDEKFCGKYQHTFCSIGKSTFK